MHYVICGKTVCICAAKHTYAYALCFINCVYMRSKYKLTEGDLHFICSIYSTQWATCYVQLYIIINATENCIFELNFALLLKNSVLRIMIT
jgi:hypothetical protein